MNYILRKSAIWLHLSLLYIPILYFAYNLLYRRPKDGDQRFFPPAPLKAVFGSAYSNNFQVEENFEKPLVFMVSSSSTKSMMPLQFLRLFPSNNSENVLFIYSQGTYRNMTHSKNDNLYKIDVAACLIGENEYPIELSSFGVYTCTAREPPKIGDEVSLLVSSRIYLHSPVNKTLENYVIDSLQANKLSDGRFVLPSTVTWNGQKDDELRENDVKYKYEICAMTQERLFPELLQPWIEYHRRIGIDRFYIYDNAGKVNLTELLDDRSDTEVVFWPWPRSQLQAQNHWILHGRRRCHWMIMFDVDEYIGLRLKGPWINSINTTPGKLKMYVRYAKHLNFSEISLDQTKMGSSGYLKQQHNVAPPEVFIHKMRIQERSPKSLFYGMHTLPDTRVHSVKQLNWYAYRSSNISEEAMAASNSFGIVHYTQRSWEEHVRKIHGPRSSYQVVKSRTKLDVNKPAVNYLNAPEDLKFDKFRKVFRAIMRLTPPSPVLWPADEDKYDEAALRPIFSRPY